MKTCRHYYVAVASEDLKLSTLVDLLCALQGRGPCAFAIVCSSRDELDKLVTGLSQVKDTSVAYLHADLDQSQRHDTVTNFLERVSQQTGADSSQAVKGSAFAEVLITTDACVKALEEDSNVSLTLPLLVNYDLPAKRINDNRFCSAVGMYAESLLNTITDKNGKFMQEVFSRRIQMVCAATAEDTVSSAAIAMYFVTAGQMGQLRAVEGFLGPAHLEVMPVHVADILQQTRQASTA